MDIIAVCLGISFVLAALYVSPMWIVKFNWQTENRIALIDMPRLRKLYKSHFSLLSIVLIVWGFISGFIDRPCGIITIIIIALFSLSLTYFRDKCYPAVNKWKYVYYIVCLIVLIATTLYLLLEISIL